MPAPYIPAPVPKQTGFTAGQTLPSEIAGNGAGFGTPPPPIETSPNGAAPSKFFDFTGVYTYTRSEPRAHARTALGVLAGRGSDALSLCGLDHSVFLFIFGIIAVKLGFHDP